MRAPSPSALRPRNFRASLGARRCGAPSFFLSEGGGMRNSKIVGSLLLVQVLFFGLAVSAQTVSPVIAECGKKCRGEFSITNNGLTPLAVSVEARSFSLDTLRHATNRPLAPTVALKVEEG